MDFVFATGDIFIPLLNLLIAMALGGLIGVERSLAGKTAGMRTYSLVAVGAAFFVVISQSLPADIIGDITRIPAAIISGIGFLGAGLIIFKEEESTVSGLTTAAGLWVAAGIGVACAYGMYIFAVGATFITLFIFTLMWDFEQKLVGVAKKEDVYSDEDKERKKTNVSSI